MIDSYAFCLYLKCISLSSVFCKYTFTTRCREYYSRGELKLWNLEYSRIFAQVFGNSSYLDIFNKSKFSLFRSHYFVTSNIMMHYSWASASTPPLSRLFPPPLWWAVPIPGSSKPFELWHLRWWGNRRKLAMVLCSGGLSLKREGGGGRLRHGRSALPWSGPGTKTDEKTKILFYRPLEEDI